MRRLSEIIRQTKSCQLWLLAGLILAIVPHFNRLPLLILVPSLALIGWRLLFDLKLTPLPHRFVRWFLTFIALGATLFSFHTVVGRQAGISLLIVMLGLKLMEMKSRRDMAIVLGLGYFVTLTVFMFDQSIFLGLYMIVVVLLLTTAQLSMNLQQNLPSSTQTETLIQPLSARQQLRAAGRILLQAAPLALLLFVLFPRIPGPLWSLPTDSFSASTGLSDSMSPGNITQLSDNEAVAFRVLFDDPLPPAQQRYWRGPVFMAFDGRSWSNPFTQSLQSGTRPQRPLNLVNRMNFTATGEPVNYRVTLEPHQRHWLFALDIPGRLPSNTWLTNDIQIIATKPVSQLLQYSILSYPSYRLEADEPPVLLGRYLQLPPNTGPQARALAQDFRDRARTAQGTAQLALDYLREQPFIYTRQPPALPDDPIDEFLFDSRRGYCEHYASAFAFLMRAAGIPARIITGYQGGEMNPLDDYFIVRQSDAHAWTEIWLPEQGWVRVDPTSVIPPSRIENAFDLDRIAPYPSRTPPVPAWTTRIKRQLAFRWDSLNHYWNQWVVNYNQSLQKDFLSKLGFGDMDWRGMVTALMTGIILVFAWLAYRLLYQRPRITDPALACYQRFCRKLARRGVVRAPDEGAVDFAQRAATAMPGQRSTIMEITRLYQQLRYAPNPPGDGIHRLKQIIARFRPRP